MHKELTKKVPQGKMVRLKIDFGKTISKIQINGDFFLYPEDSITKIESSLVGMNADDSVESFEQKISVTLKKHNAQFFGLTSQDLAQIIKEAIGETK